MAKLTEETCDYQCDAAYPMRKGATGSWWHHDAKPTNGVWSCPNCGETWRSRRRAALVAPSASAQGDEL